jgi:SAM-dependent methyltransferase
VPVAERVSRLNVREGYDRWAESYDGTANPVVALDRRYTLRHLDPKPRELILDAGCGTGANLCRILEKGGRPVGLDISRGMLRVARRAVPGVPLARADLDHNLPLASGVFHAFLCSLVSEHLTSLEKLFQEAFAVLREGGRLVFSAFHPELAAAGIEANFEQDGTEYRLGAERHTIDDYLNHIGGAGFGNLRCREYCGDSELIEEVPEACKYLGRPLLVVIEAIRRQS